MLFYRSVFFAGKRVRDIIVYAPAGSSFDAVRHRQFSALRGREIIVKMSVERDEYFTVKSAYLPHGVFNNSDRLGRSESAVHKVVLNVNDNQKLFHFLCSFYIFPFSCFFLFISNSLSLSSKTRSCGSI